MWTTIQVKSQLILELEEARQLLRKSSKSIHQSELQQKAVKVDLDQAYNALIPNLSISVNNQHIMGLNFDQITGQLITGDQWNNTSNATVSSSIFNFQGLKSLHNIKLAKLGIELAKIETEKLTYDLELQLLELFFQGLINTDLYKASLEQTKLSIRQLELEEIRVNLGKGTLLDVAQAKNKLATDQLNVSRTKKALKLTLIRLKQLLDLPNDIVLELAVPKKNSYRLVDKYLTIRKDPYIQQLDKKIEISHIQTKIAQSYHYPSIVINTGYGTNYSSRRLIPSLPFNTMPLLEQLNQNRSLHIGIGISYNIFDRFNAKANTKKSRINTETLLLEKHNIFLERQLALERATLEFQATIDEQNALEIAYEATKVNYQAMNERYEVGKSSSIDLYKALTDYNISEFRRITNKYDVMLKNEILHILLNFN